MSLVSVQHLARRVALISFNNAKKLNPMTEQLGRELAAAFSSLDPNTSSAVVLTGEGGNFSAGGDLDFLRARAAARVEENIDTMVAFYTLFLAPLRACPVPVIAAVSGACVGAGAALATACDMRAVSPSSRVGFTFTSGVAIHPGMGSTHFLPRVIGPAHAARLLLTGEMTTGAAMAGMGWGIEAAADGSGPEPALARAIDLAERAAAAAPLAVRETLATLRAAGDEGLERALQREAEAQAKCYAGPDFLRGVEAVASKQRPVWGQYADK